ncbi:MAG TPA: acyl-CoA dehydrogenase family protein, partial [Beijerinckiaceae bacterium]|nr:acyl-CoA dehydrogenase family protein [Beijerinckiaceae bacterium]
MLDRYGYATHEVLNQPPPLSDYDAYATDPTLRAVVGAFGAGWAEARLAHAGAAVGSAHVQGLARQANRFAPELRTHDRFGNRVDEIEFHPAWHELMALCMSQETHSLAWTDPRPGAQVARGALAYLWNQGESGIMCPILMTYASLPTLRADPAMAREWEAKALSTRYDPRPIPAAAKTGITVGMAMTEKQGGSDLRQTQSYAERDGELWRLVGHKWFFSVPHSDVFIALARTAGGVSCFLVPGWLPDGSRNRIAVQRLKDKAGNRSNASSEIELHGAYASLIGEEGRGIRHAVGMGHLTRLECAISSAALMRQAVAQAAHHAQYRRAFQKTLINQPIMANVVADLHLETTAAAWLAFRVAAAFDSQADASERLLARIGAPIAKYWICKRVVPVVAEALECHGGNGFIEDHVMARLYREAPLNGIWEGAGNIMCLDVLRSMQREPGCVQVLLDEIGQGRGHDGRLDAAIDRLASDLADPARHEGQARRLVERIALALSASLLVRHFPGVLADAFVASRLEAGWTGA